MREGEGDLLAAITLYMKAGIPAKAAKLVAQHQVCKLQSIYLINKAHVVHFISEVWAENTLVLL